MSRPVPKWVSAVSIASTVMLAAGAFTLSFVALTDLAITGGVHRPLAWMWPLIVDGLVVVATVAVVTLGDRRKRWYPWLLLTGGASVSVAANAYHATMPNGATMPPGMAAAVASVPPVLLLAVTHLTVILTRSPDGDGTRPTPARHEGRRASPARSAPEGAEVPVVASPQAFICSFLARQGGQASASEVFAAARAAGFGENQIKKARARCVPQVSSRRDAERGWLWELDSSPGFEG